MQRSPVRALVNTAKQQMDDNPLNFPNEESYANTCCICRLTFYGRRTRVVCRRCSTFTRAFDLARDKPDVSAVTVIHGGPSRPTVCCRLCRALTPSTGTKLCDRCWELERRVKADPDLAWKILRRLIKF